MADAGNVFGAEALNSMAITASADQFTDAIGPMMCTPRIFVGGRIGEHLDDARGIAQRTRAAVGQEGELTGLVGHGLRP
jgi:hypothetical protein